MSEKEENTGKVITLCDLLKGEYEKLPMMFGNMIPRTGLMAVTGTSEAGKSLFLRQMALSICADKSFLGWRNLAYRGKAIYITTEDGEELTRYNFNKQVSGFSISEQQQNNLRIVICPYNVVKEIRRLLTEDEADMVVIDAFGDILDGKDEKSSSDVRKILNEFSRISEEFKCLIVFLHHIGKKTEYNAPSKNSIIGSQSFEAKMRLILEIRQDNEENDIRHLCVTKCNYLPQEEKSLAYDMVLDTETLLFSLNGMRTPIERLAKKDYLNNSKSPQTLPISEHRSFLLETLQSGTFLTGNELKRAISERFCLSERTARQYLSYYTDKKHWIKCDKSSKNRYMYSLERESLS